jgi:hypothetical protein
MARDFFTDEIVGSFEGNVSIELPSHGGKVLAFEKPQ